MKQQRFGNMGGGMNMNMIRQAQKMQENMIAAQEALSVAEYEATAGGGAITAKINGKHELVALDIAPEAVDTEDLTMLSDMIIAAVNAAVKKADETAETEMKKFTGGLNIPGLF